MRIQFKSTAKRTMQACGYSGEGVGTIFPSTLARLARMVGSNAQGTQFPHSLDGLCGALEGGGGAAPAWLPDGALAFADFQNGHYYFGGAEHTLEEMFETNINWGSFNPALVQAGIGLVITDMDSGNLPSLTAGAAADFLSSGATIVADMTFPAYGDYRSHFIDATYASDWNCRIDTAIGILDDGDQTADAGSFTAASHKLSYTIAPTNVAASRDGGAVTTFTPNNSPNPSWEIIAFQLLGTFRTLTFYAPRVNGELPGLSA